MAFDPPNAATLIKDPFVLAALVIGVTADAVGLVRPTPVLVVVAVVMIVRARFVCRARVEAEPPVDDRSELATIIDLRDHVRSAS